MATNPYAWAQNLQQQEATRAMQRENTAQQMLMNVFAEEAARQRPFVTMPARLAEAQFDRINAEPFQTRAAMRRYKYSKAGQEEAATGDDGTTVDADGNEVITVGDKTYVIPADKK